MNTKKLSEFLAKAKLNTYASSGEAGEKKFADGSKGFKFKEKNFKYQDKYFGYNSFIGEEVVWQNKKLIWGMNYYGEIVSEIISVKEIYRFLREALKRITKGKPFRGPDNFKKGDFKYNNKIRGTVEKFEGKEIIFYKNKIVYKLNYHGGLVAMKQVAI